jgi:hypothetical protein
VPDNPKGFDCRGQPLRAGTQPHLPALAEHYGCAVCRRGRASPDKAKVEAAVQLVERWILARLRHWRFHSLAELNAAIRELLENLNHRPFQKLEGSRRSWFELLERPVIRRLPPTPFEYAEFKRAKVSRLDYHVEFEHHYCPAAWSARKSNCASPAARSRCCSVISAWRVTLARFVAAATARSPSTCQRRIVRIESGPRLDCCTGRPASASRPGTWSIIYSNPSRIPNKVTAPALVCSRWRASTAMRGSKRVVRVR